MVYLTHDAIQKIIDTKKVAGGALDPVWCVWVAASLCTPGTSLSHPIASAVTTTMRLLPPQRHTCLPAALKSCPGSLMMKYSNSIVVVVVVVLTPQGRSKEKNGHPIAPKRMGVFPNPRTTVPFYVERD